MQKPYIKKFWEVSGITTWIVHGYYVRQKIDINFNNFGQHYRFNFIPENEFWLDQQEMPGEEKYFIEHLLAERKLMAEGKNYNDALNEGDRVEQEMRDEDEKIKKLKEELRKNKELVIKKIRKELLDSYSNDKVKTYVVDSFLVRSLFYIDWVAGGHDKVYSFVPAQEVWIDNDIVAKERKYVLLHELHERYWMSQGWKYEEAHNSALKIESYCYKNPAELENKIREELSKQI